MKTENTVKQNSFENYTYVKVAGKKNPVLIPITDSLKPQLGKDIIEKWQHILVLMVRLLNVPTGLIMKLDKDSIQVFLSSKGKDNPYHEGDSERLNIGLYCETVVAKRRKLAVIDARKDPLWDHNPDIKLGMVSYLGYPISWPDGELFGTICVLDNKERAFSQDAVNLIHHFEQVLEDDLTQLLQNYELRHELELEKFKMNELNHRIKNNFTILLANIQNALDIGDIDYKAFLQRTNAMLRMFVNIHTMLYKRASLSMNDYIRQIVDGILISYNKQDVSINFSIDDLIMDEDYNFNLGFLLNELVTNSIKHAFSGTNNPVIDIVLKNNKDGFILEYSDNGRGIDEQKFTDKNSDSLGKSIIEILPMQMGGRLDRVDYDKAKFVFVFD